MNPSTFPLLKLPLLALTNVIQSMRTGLRLRLALTSKRMERCIRMSQLRINSPCVSFKDAASLIYIYKRRKFRIGCDTLNLERTGMVKWAPHECIYRNMEAMCAKLRDLFIFDTFDVDMRFPEMEGVSRSDNNEFLLSLLKSCFFLVIHGEVNGEDLKYLLDNTPSTAMLGLQNVEMTEDYLPIEAFRFQSFSCNASDWVRLEHLYTVRDMTTARLENSSLTDKDVNTFIKYWVDFDEDMFNKLSIETCVDLEVEMGVEEDVGVLDGVVALSAQSNYFVPSAAGTNKTRPFLVVDVDKTPGTVLLWAVSEASYRCDCCQLSMEKEAKILEVLNQKRELEKTLETDGLENRETIGKLWEVERDLREMGVKMVDGIAEME